MSRQVTQLELGLICGICFLGILLVLSCTGCASPAVLPKGYEVKIPFTIIVAEEEYIKSLLEAYGYHGSIDGYYDERTRTIYVTQDSMNKERPNFEYLGHELWHLPELGGKYHK